jgi:hypothetical protein
MTRISDLNQKRRMRFGQATLLGIRFSRIWQSRAYAWGYILPGENMTWRSCGYATRWQAVNAALHKMEVELK